jgi:hypothetical protein
LFATILSADHNCSIVAFSNVYHNSSEIKVPPLIIAISFRISFFLSPNQGALIAITFKAHLSLFKTNVVKASHSISSAIITISLFHFAASCSSIHNISLIELIFLSVIIIAGFSNTASILAGSVTKYGEAYH